MLSKPAFAALPRPLSARRIARTLGRAHSPVPANGEGYNLYARRSDSLPTIRPMTKPIPEGYHTITPTFVVKDARKAIAFYKKAFGAAERIVMPGPDGKGVMHAELTIGDSTIMLCNECPTGNVRRRNDGRVADVALSVRQRRGCGVRAGRRCRGS